MTRQSRHAALASILLGALAAAPAVSQQSDTGPRANPILEFPNLGPIPGGGESTFGVGPGGFEPGIELPGVDVLGNRKRGARISRPAKSRPSVQSQARPTLLTLPEPLPSPQPPARSPAPVTGGLPDLQPLDDEGPPGGLTLDAAIEQMMAANPDIRALRQELPQADADIVTAGLRANPLIYMDSQFIPYGSFSDARPGGPTQYDVNITYPLDVSQKRQSRLVVARLARSALEAQFHDVVRRQIANVGAAFVNLQAAWRSDAAATGTMRRREARLSELCRAAEARTAEGIDAIRQESLQLERARLAVVEAGEALADAQEALAVLINEPPETTAQLVPRGSLRDTAAPPPPLDELTKIALACRADVRAVRVGVSRANAEVALQRANRFDDVFLFYDPITIQDFSPYNRQASHSWAAGITCSLPIFNRNQGNIARATSNVRQTREELTSVERRVVSEVRLAEREYQVSRRACEQIERAILPLARERVDRRARQLAEGTISLDDYQSSEEEVADVTTSLRDALLRHRRSMLDLNTAVGLRILP